MVIVSDLQHVDAYVSDVMSSDLLAHNAETP